MTLTSQIEQAIKDNLPAAVAGELATFIKQANADKATVLGLQMRLDDSEKTFQLLKKQHDEAIETLSKYRELETREKAVQERENKFEVEVANNRVLAAETQNKALYTLVETVFRNPRLVQHESGSVAMVVPGSGTACGYSTSQPFNKITTSEEMK